MNWYEYDKLCKYLDIFYREYSPGEIARYERWKNLELKK